METFWFIAVALMLAVYIVLDGFDFGTGIIYMFVAQTDEERRLTLNAIGPVWNGNEVWLIAGGGLLFFAFPKAYASGFSGFYLALILVLWLLMLRGIAIELRSHLDHLRFSSQYNTLHEYPVRWLLRSPLRLCRDPKYPAQPLVRTRSRTA